MRNLAMCVLVGLAACGAPTAIPTPTPSAAPTAITPPTATATPVPTANGTPSTTATPTADAGAEGDGATSGSGGVVADSSEWLDKCQTNGKEFERKTHPDIKQCHADGSKKGYLKGSAKITFKIDWDGKKKDVRTSEKSDLPKPVVDCMIKVVKDAAFGDPEACKGKDLTIVLKFPPTH